MTEEYAIAMIQGLSDNTLAIQGNIMATMFLGGLVLACCLVYLLWSGFK